MDTRAVGSYVITYTATDGSHTTSVTRTVVVVDSTAPTMTAASATPNVLWPPNGKMVPGGGDRVGDRFGLRHHVRHHAGGQQ